MQRTHLTIRGQIRAVSRAKCAGSRQRGANVRLIAVGVSNMRLAQISDCHLYADADARHYGADVEGQLSRVLARVAAWQPDLVVASGDLSEDGSAESYARLRGHFESLNTPVLAMPGNHDDPDAMAAALGAATYRASGELMLASWRLLILDTRVPNEDHGELADEQLTLLDQAMADQARPTLIFLHHHPVPVGSPWIDRLGLRNPEALFARLDSADCVHAIAFGHIHQVFESRLGGMRLLSAPSTSTQARPRREQFVDDVVGPGFRWFELADDGSLETGVIRCEAAQSSAVAA